MTSAVIVSLMIRSNGMVLSPLQESSEQEIYSTTSVFEVPTTKVRKWETLSDACRRIAAEKGIEIDDLVEDTFRVIEEGGNYTLHCIFDASFRFKRGKSYESFFWYAG